MFSGFFWQSIQHYIWHLSARYHDILPGMFSGIGFGSGNVQRAAELAIKQWCPVSAIWRMQGLLHGRWLRKRTNIQNSSGHTLEHFGTAKKLENFTHNPNEQRHRLAPRLNSDTLYIQPKHNLNTAQTQPRHNPDTPAKSETQPRHNPDTPTKSETQPRHPREK